MDNLSFEISVWFAGAIETYLRFACGLREPLTPILGLGEVLRVACGLREP